MVNFMQVALNDGTIAEVDDKYADAIAKNMAKDYPGTTRDMVITQLNKPAEDRDIIGMFAYGMLESNDLIPET
jgi:hypothetical protein